MNQAYQKISDQKGLDEFKKLIQKWEHLSRHIESTPTGTPIILPDIFLVSRSGTGRTYLLKLLSEYLSEKGNLMSFYGDVKYFEFMLNYCAPSDHFSEIQRLMTEIDNAAGFRSEYKGIVYIDIDEWLYHFEEKHFISFMEYLSDNSDEWLVVLSVSDTDADQIDRLEALISAFLRIERLGIEVPKTDDLLFYLKKLLSSYGFSLDEGASAIVSESIDALRRNKYFDGYKTVKILGQDIAYSVCASCREACSVLNETDVAPFSENSEYIKKMIAVKEKVKQQIGFC